MKFSQLVSGIREVCIKLIQHEDICCRLRMSGGRLEIKKLLQLTILCNREVLGAELRGDRMSLLIDYGDIERDNLCTQMKRCERFDHRSTLAHKQLRGEKGSDQSTMDENGNTHPTSYSPSDAGRGAAAHGMTVAPLRVGPEAAARAAPQRQKPTIAGPLGKEAGCGRKAMHRVLVNVAVGDWAVHFIAPDRHDRFRFSNRQRGSRINGSEHS